MDFEIDPLWLLQPALLDADGQAFLAAYGVDHMTLAELQAASRRMDNGKVRVSRRCAQLQDDGRCGIYEQRPAVCRAFDCATRGDCSCGGRGYVPVDAISFESELE
jgi:Fe-S-cluster containining protein